MEIDPEIIGMVAAILTTLSFLPQAIKTIRTRETHAISLSMYAMFTAGVACWLVFGIMIESYSVAVANFFTLGLAMTILVLKIKHG